MLESLDSDHEQQLDSIGVEPHNMRSVTLRPSLIHTLAQSFVVLVLVGSAIALAAQWSRLSSGVAARGWLGSLSGDPVARLFTSYPSLPVPTSETFASSCETDIRAITGAAASNDAQGEVPFPLEPGSLPDSSCEGEVMAQLKSEGESSNASMSPAIGSITVTPQPPLSASENSTVVKLLPGRFNMSEDEAAPLLWSTTINAVSCFRVAANNADGEAFDEGCRQRAYFAGLLVLLPNPVDVLGSFHSNMRGGQPVMNVTVPLRITYNRTTSDHKVCFVAPFPGTFSLHLHLLFTNIYHLLHEIEPKNAKGFTGVVPVLTARVTATAADGFSLEAHRSSLPRCTFATVTSSGNYGFWMDLQWYPSACQLSRLSLDQVFSCLHGKNLLMIGDSQTRFTFAAWVEYLSAPNRATFLNDLRTNPRKYNSLHFDAYELAEYAPIKKGDDKVLTGQWRSGQNAFTFYGTYHNGFTKASLNRTTVDSMAAFNITFITKMGMFGQLVPPWMFDRNVTGGEIVFHPGQQFDHVLMSTVLHDIETVATASDYAKSLAEAVPHFIPLAQQQHNMTFIGPWAVLEATRPLPELHMCNNPRTARFAAEEQRFLANERVGHFIPLMDMTSCRPDLNLDSIHYPMVVSLAILDLWVTDFCRSTCSGSRS